MIVSEEYIVSRKFKLIVDHLDAVQTLHEYITGVELKHDLKGMSEHLRRDLTHTVFQPVDWEDLEARHGSLYSRPRSKPKWRVVRGGFIEVEICAEWLFEDGHPYVQLAVPPGWKKQSQFIAKLKAPPGFEHPSNYPPGDFTPETSIFKYIPYESCIGAKGEFDATVFRDAANILVRMEGRIDKILEGLA
jgi:hypothetical protein